MASGKVLFTTPMTATPIAPPSGSTATPWRCKDVPSDLSASPIASQEPIETGRKRLANILQLGLGLVSVEFLPEVTCPRLKRFCW